MGWLQRADVRNQLRTHGDNDRYRSEQIEDDDTSVTEATGSYAAYLPGWLGALGVAVAVVAGELRLRQRSTR